MNLDAAVQTFLAESRELLDAMEHGLLCLEADVTDPEPLHAIFRAAHTIKGSAGIFGFDPLVDFTHHVETLLDALRAGELRLNADGIAVLLACVDHIRTLLEPVVQGQPLAAQTHGQGEALIQRLQHYGDRSPAAIQAAAPAAVPTPRVASDGVAPAERVAVTDFWHISLRFGHDVLRNGMDPLAFLRYLTTLGDMVHLTVLDDALPAAADMDPEACYLGFEIDFKSDADRTTIENVFEFVRDDCLLRILPPHSQIDPPHCGVPDTHRASWRHSGGQWRLNASRAGLGVAATGGGKRPDRQVSAGRSPCAAARRNPGTGGDGGGPGGHGGARQAAAH
jgi:two-component system chemotaxis sensor kinase CheA